MENAVLEKVHNSENDKAYTFRVCTYNKVSSKGLDIFPLDSFEIASDIDNADAFILRSHKLHDAVFPKSLKAIGRAGAGVNNIPTPKCTDAGIVVFNSPGANANAVKELVISGLLLASRDIIGGIDYVKSISDQGDDIPSLVEKNKSRFKGSELVGKTLGVIGLGAIGLQVANAGLSLGMEVQGYDPFISVKVFNILPLNGKTAWFSLFLPCFADPPAESPSTINNSVPSCLEFWQSANLPGRPVSSRAPFLLTFSLAFLATSLATAA